MVEPKHVMGIGTATLDRLIKVPGPPNFGAGNRVTNLGTEGGGPVATALVAARRLGLRASLIARIGTDPIAAEIEVGLVREGIDLHWVEHHDATRSVTSTILIDPRGERAILNDPGEDTEPAVTDALIEAVRAADGLLLWSGSPASLALARAASESKTVVMLDAGKYHEDLLEVIPFCDIVIGSTYFAQGRGLSPGDAVDELIAQGVTVAVITCGEAGAVGREQGESAIHVPACPVDVVDTTGAGDVYHGAFMAGWLEAPVLADAMRLAAVAAAMTCRFPGGRRGIPTYAQAQEALANWRRR
jgi:sugar/nucleoside kinase (ribokinase family)